MKYMYKFFLIISFFTILFLLVLILKNIFLDKNYIKTFNFNNKEVNININCKNKRKSKKVFIEINKVFTKFDNYLKKENETNTLYYINHNFEKDEYLTLDKDLYSLIKYGKDIYYKSNGLIDISKGNIIDLYNSYFIINKEPSKEEIKYASNNKIEEIKLENMKIKNNHVNINVDYIVDGYVFDYIKKILKKNKINDYLINNGENIVIGSNIKKIGISNPDNEENLLFKLEEKNKNISIVNYKYDNIIGKDNNIKHRYKSVVVIANTSKQANFLAKTIYLMNENEIKEFLKKNNYEKVYIYTLDNKLIKM